MAARVLQGETALFEIIMRRYKRYNQRVYRVTLSILGDDAEAEAKPRLSSNCYCSSLLSAGPRLALRALQPLHQRFHRRAGQSFVLGAPGYDVAFCLRLTADCLRAGGRLRSRPEKSHLARLVAASVNLQKAVDAGGLRRLERYLNRATGLRRQ